MYGWNERPSKVEPKHPIGGDNPARVFEIGKYRVVVPDDREADVTYTVPHWRSGQDDPRQTFPNMQVTDGEVRFPVEDLVPLILSRLEPVELARSLWQNEEVREAFIEAAVERYSQDGIGIADRRKLVRGLQGAVHSEVLDRAVNMIATLEQRFGPKWFFWNQVEAVIKNVYPDAEDVRVLSPDSDEQFKVVGKNWQEAREHWRQELLSLFPSPAKEDEA